MVICERYKNHIALHLRQAATLEIDITDRWILYTSSSLDQAPTPQGVPARDRLIYIPVECLQQGSCPAQVLMLHGDIIVENRGRGQHFLVNVSPCQTCSIILTLTKDTLDPTPASLVSSLHL